MPNNRRGGIIYVAADGLRLDARGNWTWNDGRPKRDGIAGADGIHGFRETIQLPFIEGEITDSPQLDMDALQILENATVTLELANGKVKVLREAWYAGEGTGNTEEGNVAVRFEGISMETLPAAV